MRTSGSTVASRVPSIADIRTASAMLRASGTAAGRAVAEALDAVLSNADPRAALGLRSKAGQRSAITKDRLERRDELIRQMAARFFPSQGTSEQSRSIATVATAYWRRAAALDQRLATMPDGYAETPRALLFTMARLPVPRPAERNIRAILSRGKVSADECPEVGNEGGLFVANRTDHPTPSTARHPAQRKERT